MLAQGLAIQTPGLGQCFIVVICHAPELQVKQETVNVRETVQVICSRTYLSLINFQLKGHGQPGEHLEHAQQHVALEVTHRQEATLAIDHALVVTQTHNHVLVSSQVYYAITHFVEN